MGSGRHTTPICVATLNRSHQPKRRFEGNSIPVSSTHSFPSDESQTCSAKPRLRSVRTRSIVQTGMGSPIKRHSRLMTPTSRNDGRSPLNPARFDIAGGEARSSSAVLCIEATKGGVAAGRQRPEVEQGITLATLFARCSKEADRLPARGIGGPTQSVVTGGPRSPHPSGRPFRHQAAHGADQLKRHSVEVPFTCAARLDPNAERVCRGNRL